MHDDQSPPRRLLTVKEAARTLGQSNSTVWNMLAAGALPRVKLSSRATRIDSADLDRYIERCKGAGEAA